MYSCVYTYVMKGIEAEKARVESVVLPGMPSFTLSGLEAGAGKALESRIRAAMTHAGFRWPRGRVITSLAPEGQGKGAKMYDLPVAISLLEASGQIGKRNDKRKVVLIGELGLDGSLYAESGIYACLEKMAKEAEHLLILPEGYKAEIAAFPDLKAVTVCSLEESIDAWKGLRKAEPIPEKAKTEDSSDLWLYQNIPLLSLSGQKHAVRALMLSLAGWHPLLFLGSPGCGKSMLAESSSFLMPPLAEEEYRELRRIYSFSDVCETNNPIRRPFIQPHSSVTARALLGGGVPVKPGLFTLATHGILYMDEFLEMSSDALEALREAMENKTVLIARGHDRVRLPADFLLIAASNPCRCGLALEEDQRCRCQDAQMHQYFRKLSGPIRDRFHLLCCMSSLTSAEIGQIGSSRDRAEIAAIRKKVADAVEMQRSRNKELSLPSVPNGKNKEAERFKHWRLRREAVSQAQKLCRRFRLSARSYCNLLAVARTAADLEQSEEVFQEHIECALLYRFQPEEQIGV